MCEEEELGRQELGRSLGDARKNKNDEFYTRLEDIENELKHYKNHFKDKVVLCNCDDPYESNFFKFFAMNFNELGLKKLMATCYDGSPVSGTQLSIFDDFDNLETTKIAHKIVINEVKDFNNDGVVNLVDVEHLLKNKQNILTKLDSNGDFRSEECIKMLDEADIVVTNPPFSLFREYVGTLISHNKKFLIIGNMNAITYKEIFPLLKENKIWIGYNSPKTFYVPNGGSRNNVSETNGVKTANFGNIYWFTNLDITKRHESILDELYKKYNEKDYPSYINYDAINVDKVADIPIDYFGKMGVPITYVNIHNNDEFEIIGFGAGNMGVELGVSKNLSDEQIKKFRKANSAFRLGIPCYFEKKQLKVPYARIIIRRRQNGNDN